MIKQLKQDKELRIELKKEINAKRKKIEGDKKEFTDRQGMQNPLTDMRMLKQALGIKPNELDN